MSYLHGKFVWFECVTRDVPRAKAFYGEVLGWTVEAFPMGKDTYEMIKAGAAMVGGYAPPQDPAAPAHWISYVSVPDVDLAAKAVVAAGGKLLAPPFDIPTVGRMAQVSDPHGAAFNLFRSAQGDEPDGKATHGTFHWNELWTSDAGAAVSFYETLLGYTHRDMDMGPAGTYYVLERDGVPRAGIMASKGAAPTWTPYVAVDDCDAALARATRNGGKQVAAPEDIPGVGRFAIFTDPAGATLAIIKPASEK